MQKAPAHNTSGDSLLASAMAACRTGFLCVCVFSLLINGLMLAVPLYMLQLYDRVLTSRSTDTLMLLTAIAIAAVLTMAALESVRGHLMIRISTWLEGRLSGPILSGSIATTLRAGGGPSVQGLRDVSTFRSFLGGAGVFPIMDAPWTPIFLAVIFAMHPVLGWIAIGGAIVLFSLAIANELATRELLGLSGNASIGALRQAEAAVRNADVIEAMGMMPNLVGRWNRENTKTLDLQAQASNRSSRISSASKFIRLCLQVGILGTGAWLVILGELTPGAMIAGSILMGRALAPVEQAIGSWKAAIAARNAYQRVKAQLENAPPTGDAMPLPTPEGRVEVEGLAFVHQAASEPVFRQVSFVLEPGEAMGLIGPTAAGKTTLARLLVGNLDPRVGHVRLDGADVSVWESQDLGKHVGYLPQDVELFSGTVRENIARMGEGDPDAVVAAARLAGVHEMILKFPDGYETEIGDGGAALSGGQRQRLALARAVYGDPKFVVLDEPNASLDSEGEEALVSAVRTLKERGVTMVIIAHRPNIILHVDKLLVLRGGTMEAFGPRDEVVPTLSGPKAVEATSVGVP
ncbi:MAG: type I secretion system permease/ATPase [Rhodospirillales bacterium]|jgi:PrtD family type I secretion system ABC transporter|nr:type I secretion system permease/ATPase [Rhodospirillales bacterium]